MAVETRAPAVIGVGVLMIILSTGSVVLRMISRVLSPAGISWDDWLCVICLPLVIAIQALNIEATNHGFGYHDYDGPPDAVSYTSKMKYIYEQLYTISLSLIKLSVLLFYRRVFRPASTTLKIILWITEGMTIAWCIVVVFTAAFQCTPVEAAWNLQIEGHCFNEIAFFVGQAVPNVVLDFIILIIPIPLLLKLRVAIPQKIGLVVVFVLGYFVPIISIVRLTSTIKAFGFVAAYEANPRSDDPDITWNFVDANLWTTMEPALCLFSSCIPALQYIFAMALSRYFTSKNDSRQGRSNYELNPSRYTKQATLHGDESLSRLCDDKVVEGTNFVTSDLDNSHQAVIKHVDDGPDSDDNSGVPVNQIHVQNEVIVHKEPMTNQRRE